MQEERRHVRLQPRPHAPGSKSMERRSSARLWQVGLVRGALLRGLGVQVQGVAAAGPGQAVLGSGLLAQATVQRAVPLALGAAAGRAGHHIQLPHRMPDLHVQLLHVPNSFSGVVHAEDSLSARTNCVGRADAHRPVASAVWPSRV